MGLRSEYDKSLRILNTFKRRNKAVIDEWKSNKSGWEVNKEILIEWDRLEKECDLMFFRWSQNRYKIINESA